MRTILFAIFATSLSTAAFAQVTHFTANDGSACTKTVDAVHHNVSITCSQPTSATPDDGSNTPAPQADGDAGADTSPTAPAVRDGVANENGSPDLDQFIPALPHRAPTGLASLIVGKWHFQLTMNGMPLDATEMFTADHHYVLAAQFPQAQRVFGDQVAIETGRYEVHGNVLTEVPSEIKVFRGPKPDRLCNLQSGRCFTPPLSKTVMEMQVLNNNHIHGSLEDADFVAVRQAEASAN